MLANKKRCSQMVASARRSGKLIPQPCRNCGATQNIHAHHPDYNKPLDIVWLCQKCYADLHNKKFNLIGPLMKGFMPNTIEGKAV